MDDTLPDNQRPWDEFDTPSLTVTLLDGAGNPIILANIQTLTLTEWIETVPPGRPGIIATNINGRNAQNVLNMNNVTVASTSGVITWQLQTTDTTMQTKDLTAVEEKHHFRFTATYTSSVGTLEKSYPDFFIVKRRRLVN